LTSSPESIAHGYTEKKKIQVLYIHSLVTVKAMSSSFKGSELLAKLEKNGKDASAVSN